MKVENIQINQNVPDHVKQDLTALRDAIGKVVGSTFFGTLLKSMRESKLSDPYIDGGRGEEVFAEQLHGMYAERLGTSISKGSIVEAMYKRLATQQKRISQQDTTQLTQEFIIQMDGTK